MRSGIATAILCVVYVGDAFGQEPSRWIGDWTLDRGRSVIARSEIGHHRMTISREGNSLALAEKRFFSNGRSVEGTARLPRDGTVRRVGGIVQSFREVDQSTFEIVRRVDSADTNIYQVSRFVVSADGQTMTETRTTTEDTGTTVSTLVFTRIQ